MTAYRSARLGTVLALLSCSDATGPREEPVGPAAHLQVISGDGQAAEVATTLPEALVVRVRDADGRPVPGHVVNFRVAEGGGTVFAGAAQTNANGEAREIWTIGPVARDTQRVEVRAVDATTGAPIVFATFKAVGRPAAAAALAKAGVDSTETVVATAVPAVPRVRVADRFGNGVEGVTVRFDVTAGGGAVSSSTADTDTAGIATPGSWTVGTAIGVNTLTASSERVAGATLAFTATARAGPAARLTLGRAASGARAGQAFSQQPVVRVEDAYGNPVTAAAPVTLQTGAGTTVIGTATVTSIEGVATFTNVGIGGSVGRHVLTFAMAGTNSPGTVEQQVDLTAGPFATLVLHRPASGAVGGQPFTTQPIVHVVDDYGNPAEYTHPVAIYVTGPSYSAMIGTRAMVPVAGVAAFQDAGVSAAAGEYTLTYDINPGSGRKFVTQPLTVAIGTPERYAVSFSSPAVAAGSGVTVSARLVDANGAAVPRAGEAVTWNRTGGGGVFSSGSSLTDAAGVATVTFTSDTILTNGIVTIRATDAATRTGAAALAMTAGPAANLSFETPPQRAASLIVMPGVRVQVRDRYGNFVSDDRQVAIAVGANPAGATLGGSLSVQSVGGIATYSDLVLDRAGSGFTLVASSAELPPATSAPFDVDEMGVVATNQAGFNSLHRHGAYLYWAAGSYVYRAAPTGLGSRAIAGRPAEAPNVPANVFSDGTWVYYTQRIGMIYSGVEFYRAPVDSGPSTLIHSTPRVEGGGTVYDIAFDGTYLFYTVPRQPITRVRVSDGAATPMTAAAEYPLVVADGLLYYVDGTVIRSVPVGGGTPATVVTGVGTVSFGQDLIVVGGTLYWGEGGSIRSAPVTGGAAVTRLSGLTRVRNMVSDGTSLYVNDDGSLKRVDLATFAAATIAANAMVAQIAVDDEAVYWTSNLVTGTISAPRLMKRRK